MEIIARHKQSSWEVLLILCALKERHGEEDYSVLIIISSCVHVSILPSFSLLFSRNAVHQRSLCTALFVLSRARIHRHCVHTVCLCPLCAYSMHN